MRPDRLIVAGLACLAAGAAWAGGERPLAYAEFAENVPHIPLVDCPAVVTVGNADCHVAVIDGKLHVLAFSRTGDRRLVAVHSESGERSGSDIRLSMIH